MVETGWQRIVPCTLHYSMAKKSGLKIVISLWSPFQKTTYLQTGPTDDLSNRFVANGAFVNTPFHPMTKLAFLSSCWFSFLNTHYSNNPTLWVSVGLGQLRTFPRWSYGLLVLFVTQALNKLLPLRASKVMYFQTWYQNISDTVSSWLPFLDSVFKTYQSQ